MSRVRAVLDSRPYRIVPSNSGAGHITALTVQCRNRIGLARLRMLSAHHSGITTLGGLLRHVSDSDPMTDVEQTAEGGNQDFTVNPRTVPIELLPNFDHADFLPEPTVKERLLQVSVMDRLDDTMRNHLADLYGIR